MDEEDFMKHGIKRTAILLNHEPELPQLNELRERFGVTEMRYPGEKLKFAWSKVSAVEDNPAAFLKEIIKWLEAETAAGDYIWVQGEWGAAFFIVSWALAEGRIPVYAASERQVAEERYPDGTIHSQRIFRHVQFKLYQKWKISLSDLDNYGSFSESKGWGKQLPKEKII
jgi:hypothetical protein